MSNWLFKTRLARLAALSLVTIDLLYACAKPEPVDSNLTPSAQYALKDIRYFLAQGDRVDTTIVQLKGSSVQNQSAIPVTQQVEEGFGGLAKTSQFRFDRTDQLPKDADLRTVEVSVPQHWYGNGLFDRSIETYVISTIEQQKSYGFDPNRMVAITIPPSSRIDIRRQITAYQLTCSFAGVLENSLTGQRYNISGKWNGLLEYANPATTLKQSAL